jgi:chromosome segregation ATPase
MVAERDEDISRLTAEITVLRAEVAGWKARCVSLDTTYKTAFDERRGMLDSLDVLRAEVESQKTVNRLLASQVKAQRAEVERLTAELADFRRFVSEQFGYEDEEDDRAALKEPRT